MFIELIILGFIFLIATATISVITDINNKFDKYTTCRYTFYFSAITALIFCTAFTINADSIGYKRGFKDGYKQGQIDYQKGIVKYKMEIKQVSDTTYIFKNK